MSGESERYFDNFLVVAEEVQETNPNIYPTISKPSEKNKRIIRNLILEFGKKHYEWNVR